MLLLPLPYLPRCSLLLFVLVKRRVEQSFFTLRPTGPTLTRKLCVLEWGWQARMMLLVLLLCTQQICLNFVVLCSSYTPLWKGVVCTHTYRQPIGVPIFRKWMDEKTMDSKGSRVTQINGYVLIAHPLSDSAICFPGVMCRVETTWKMLNR